MTCSPSVFRLILLRAERSVQVGSPTAVAHIQALLQRLGTLQQGVVGPLRKAKALPPKPKPLAVVARPEVAMVPRMEADTLGERMREAEGARALLLEVVRRAAFDWVLYRSSSRLEQKLLAEDAYTWIFVEDEEHLNYRTRKDEGKVLTAFVSICDALDLDPERVRGYVRKLTPNKVMSSGRPPENSRASDPQISVIVHTTVPDLQGGEGTFDFDALLGQMLDG